MRPVRFVAAAALVSLACGGETPQSAQQSAPSSDVVLDAHDFAFSGPDTIASGIVHVRMSNTGKDGHHAQFIRLNDGVTAGQFDSVAAAAMAALPTEGEAAVGRIFAIATLAGGSAPANPGQESSATLELTPGLYVMTCFLAGADGVPHMVKGMVKHFVVSPAVSQAAAPATGDSVELGDFAFAKVPELKAGANDLVIRNIGKEPHEMAVVRLKGITAQQFLQLTAPPAPGAPPPPPGPPPFEWAGGLQAIMPGARAWTTLNLTPGDYVLLCFVPSPANTGKPHAALGMMKPFTIKG